MQYRYVKFSFFLQNVSSISWHLLLVSDEHCYPIGKCTVQRKSAHAYRVLSFYLINNYISMSNALGAFSVPCLTLTG